MNVEVLKFTSRLGVPCHAGTARYRVFRATNGPRGRRNWHLVDRAAGTDCVYNSYAAVLSVLRGECPDDSVRVGVQNIFSMDPPQARAVLGLSR